MLHFQCENGTKVSADNLRGDIFDLLTDHFEEEQMMEYFTINQDNFEGAKWMGRISLRPTRSRR